MYLRINVESWRRRAWQCGEPVLVTMGNVKGYVPDLPEEFFRLPYPEARADAIRWALIYHQGGIFLEPDVLMTGGVAPILEKLAGLFKVAIGGARPGKQDSYDLVSSQEDPAELECSDQFNPAILAGPKGSPYFKA